MNRERILLVGAVVLGCMLMTEALWRGPFFPSNDGPHHVFGAFARSHIDDADRDYAAYLVANGPTSANGFADVFALLEPALGTRDAERATLALVCAVFLIGAVLLARALHPARAWLGLVAGAGALGWPLFLGFYEFVLASGLAFLVVVFALRARTTAHHVVLALLLLFVALVHFSVALLACALLLVLRLCERERSARSLAILVASSLPALAVVVRATHATANHSDINEVLPVVYRITALGGCTVGGAPWRQAMFAAVALVGIALCAARPRGRTRIELACCAVAVGGIALPLCAPWTFLGWQHAAVRALPLCAALAIALVPLERLSSRARAAASVACFSFLVASTLWARALLDRAAEDLRDVEVALATSTRAGYRLSVVTLDPPWLLDAGLLRWDPMRALGSLFGVVHGGLPAYAHVVSPQAHTVLVRADLAPNLPQPPVRSRHQSRLRAIDDDQARKQLLAPVLESARGFESVVAFERPADHAAWKEAGFDVVAEHGRVLLLSVPVPAAASPAAPVTPP